MKNIVNLKSCLWQLFLCLYSKLFSSSPSIALFKDGELVHFVER
ncbi:MAG: BrxA/BrxB family bacilliredoxin, partial [Bacteroidia bacterium]